MKSERAVSRNVVSAEARQARLASTMKPSISPSLPSRGACQPHPALTSPRSVLFCGPNVTPTR